MKLPIKLFVIFFICALMWGCLIAKEKEKKEKKSESAAESYVYLYANGETIGRMIDYDGATVALEFDSSFDYVRVYADGEIKMDEMPILFEQPDCMGQAYAHLDFFYGKNEPFRLGPKKGQIFSCIPGKCEFILYYLAPLEKFYYRGITVSQYFDGYCSNFTRGGEWFYYKLHPNDPAITNIKDYPFPTPLTFEGMETLQMTLGN